MAMLREQARLHGRAFPDMSRYDYHMVMTKETRAGVAELKARLSAYLRDVRRGHPVAVYDRDTPVARLVPYVEADAILTVRRPRRELKEVVLPEPLGRPVDSLSALLEERQSSR